MVKILQVVKIYIFAVFILKRLKYFFYCNFKKVIKDGVKLLRKNHLCKLCGKQLVFRKHVDNEWLYYEYVFSKQTLKQLSKKYRASISTIQCKLSSICSTLIISSSKNVIVLMDATYRGRNLGVLVMKDSRTRKILWRKFFRKETLSDYRDGVEWLLENDFKIEVIVCDWLRGMLQAFSRYRVQMC